MFQQYSLKFKDTICVKYVSSLVCVKRCSLIGLSRSNDIVCKSRNFKFSCQKPSIEKFESDQVISRNGKEHLLLMSFINIL